MPFNPTVNQELAINGRLFRVAGHPAVPTLPYGQEGRMATVYKIVSKEREYALKVFKAAYRKPDIHALSEKLKGFANIPGLEVCERHVLDPDSYRALIREYPDLSYAVMMPWMDGETWMDVITNQLEISKDQSEQLFGNFCRILGELEQRSSAHCDLSGPNVIIHDLADTATIYLVDVEQMHAPQMSRPALLLAGTPGYAPRKISDELWNAHADRFAGAVLLAEMLCWYHPEVRKTTWAESYFDPDEIQQESERYQLLTHTLEENWGPRAGELFRQAWMATTLETCPPFLEWQSLFADEEVVILSVDEEVPNAEVTDVGDVTEEEETESAKVVPEPVTESEPDPIVSQYQEFETAIEQAQKENQSVDEYLHKINLLSLQQIYNHLDMSERYDPAEVGLSIVKPFVPGKESGKALGGFTGGQYTGVLFAFPVIAAVLLYVLRNMFGGSTLWYTISLPALVSAMLYTGLRRKWVATLIYIPIVFIGGIAAQQQNSDLLPQSMLILALISGAAFEILVQIGSRMISDPIQNLFQDLLWAILLGFTAGAIIDEGAYEAITKINDVNYIMVNLFMASFGWVLGKGLNQMIIQMRERTK